MTWVLDESISKGQWGVGDELTAFGNPVVPELLVPGQRDDACALSAIACLKLT